VKPKEAHLKERDELPASGKAVWNDPGCSSIGAPSYDCMSGCWPFYAPP